MPARTAVVVRYLPNLTTVDDVKTWFDTRIRGANAFVFPLVQDTQNASRHFMCTIATVEASEKVALSLNAQEFVPKLGGKSRIQIDASFIGPITLAEQSNPQFDVYFVHGVGGNALSSWVCEATGHMWPRDSFAEQCHSMGVRGRFSSIGYDAKIIDKGEPKTIQKAAESLLSYVRADRPLGCTRPIFFVCHSLGGLVVTQAIVLALEKPAIKPEYQFIQHLIQGVAYFGTPFQGSRNADVLTPVVKVVAGTFNLHANFLEDMKTFSRSLPGLMMHFNHIRTEERIEILSFVEKKRDVISKVTTSSSAILPFKTDLAPIEIDADHRNMVKFPSANEARLAITEIVNMIKRKLGLAVIPSPSGKNGEKRLSTLPVPDLPDEIKHKDKNEGFSQLAQFDTVFVIDDTGTMQRPAKSADPEDDDTITRWDVLTKALQYIADIAARYDEDGIDVHYLISKQVHRNVATGQEVLNLLAQVDLTKGGGGTYFESVLAKILGPYVANYEEYFENVRKRLPAEEPKPLNIIVLTDGEDDDEEATEELLVDIARKLDKMNVPRSQVGIQFLQVGDDKKAADFLDRLDNDLKKIYGVRDFVDTKTFKDMEANNADFTENLRRILLGAVNRKLDKVASRRLLH